MTATNEATLEDLFALMEIPTLRSATAQHQLEELDYDDLARYAASALARWHVDYGDQTEQLSRAFDAIAERFGLWIFTAFSTPEEMPNRREVDAEGRLWIHDTGWIGNDRIEVTEKSLRHWQWMHALLTDHDAADAFLVAVPAVVREHAERQVEKGPEQIALGAQVDGIFGELPQE